MADIVKLFLDGELSKLSKEVLSDDVVDVLLPEVTSSDEGKVLVVNAEGKFELKQLDTNFVVNITEVSSGVMTADKTFQETLQAHNAGRTVIFAFQGIRCIATYADHQFTGLGLYPYEISAESMIANIAELISWIFMMGEREGATFVEGGMGLAKFLPTVTSDDNGKLLKVVNGDWVATNQ